MATKDMDPNSLIDALTKPLSAAMVKELDDKIATLEGEITERRNKIESLLMLKKFDDVRKNGKPARKAKGEGKGKKHRDDENGGGAATSPNSPARDAAVHAYLMRHGPSRAAAISSGCNIPLGSMSNQMARMVTAKRVVVVPEGWKAI